MDMMFVKRPHRNLVSVGWENGFLQVEFKGGRRYLYGGVPEAVKDKLLRSPFADNLFSKIVRNRYVSERVDLPPSKPVPQYPIDYDSLPF